MIIASVTEFVEALRDNQLLEPAQLKELSLEMPQDPEALAQQLRQRGWLTAFQADQLLQGQGKDLVLGPYRLLDMLGEGGMGQVFRAVHQRLGRVVALKVIRPERVSQNPEVVRRFQREARAAAQLSHPNVIIIYDADQVGDRHFIAMEYVEGIDLAALVRDGGPLPVTRACDYIRQAALGLQHAHERDLVHRDIKPSNLFVSRPSTRAASAKTSGRYRVPQLAPQSGPDDQTVLGSPRPQEPAAPTPEAVVKILDMGLARLLESPDGSSFDSSLTQEGLLMGTPDYIAPEQARNSHNVDIRADLYSLGCTLYFLLTGQPPFPQGTTIEKLLMHQLDEPQPVEDLRPGLPDAVTVVVRKLMAKRPEDRYQTPADVVAVLAALPTNGDSAAVPQPAVAAPVATTALTQIVPDLAVPAAPAKASDSASRIRGAKKLAVLKGHHGWVMALAFAPDRNTLASGGVDESVRLWDFSRTRPREMPVPRVHQGDVNALAFAPDNQTLASGSGTLDGLIWLWDLAGTEPRKKAVLQGHNTAVDALAFAPDGRTLVSGGGKTVRLWDLTGDRFKERAVFRGHTDYVKCVTFSPDSKVVASGGQDGTVRLWGTTWKLWSHEQAVIHGHRGQVHSVAFAPHGQALASGGMDQTVRLWDLSGAAPEERLVLRGHRTLVRAVLFTPAGDAVISVETAGRVIRWDVTSGKKVHEWMLSGAMVSSVALTFDGRYVATANSEGHVLVFRLTEKTEEKTPVTRPKSQDWSAR
ncbi:MAG TPA: serine/threonine-protein kinase [Gemmataceae bacterium]|jgi:serine/threonine-protein kinase|nr:serine/threonine-protein kinase [Gemmataceae bacterium]